MTAARVVCRAVGLLAVALPLSCNAILGIDEAHDDPALDGAPGGTCGAYCAQVTANCTGANSEYVSQDVCEELCKLFDPGLPGDVTSDSLACRAHFAAAAQGDPAKNCQAAGAVGGGVCGKDPCAAFCELAAPVCEHVADPPYQGRVAVCDADCKTSPAALAYHRSEGDVADMQGNTLNCRIYHLQAALDPTNPSALSFHCPHTDLSSTMCNK